MLTGFSRHVNTIAQKKSLNYILQQKTSLLLSFSFIEHCEIIRKHLTCPLVFTNDIIASKFANLYSVYWRSFNLLVIGIATKRLKSAKSIFRKGNTLPNNLNVLARIRGLDSYILM